MPCLKKIGKAVFQIITSGFISEFLYSNSNFSIFAKTWEYYLCTFFALCIKFDVSIFIGFIDIKRLVFTMHSHTNAFIQIYTHICTNQFPKTTFMDSGDLQTYKSGENSRSKILSKNNTSIIYRKFTIR